MWPPPDGIDVPYAMADWSLTSLQQKMIKIGACVVCHARAITFQQAEVAVTDPMVRACDQFVDQVGHRAQIMRLSRHQPEIDEVAGRVGQCQNFGGDAAARPPYGLALSLR